MGIWAKTWVLICLLAASGTCAQASVAFLLEEPYGEFGAVNPTGHAAIYFNHICADTPALLRPCHNGEYGVVISRYHKIDGYDWLAVPLVGYLYAVDSPNDIPVIVDKEQVALLRNEYRRKHLLALAPDQPSRESPKGEWTQLAGASYDRTIHVLQFDSTPAQDLRFIAAYNDKRNVGHFNIFFHNCADFSRVVLDIYLPHAIHRNFIADAGLMTPKQVARSLMRYAKKNPELTLTAFVIPQIPGNVPRSHPVDGVAESLIKSKKYLVPMALLAPEVTGGVIVAYLAQGRLSLPRNPQDFDLAAERTTNYRRSRPALAVPAPSRPVPAAAP
ncbi:MAG: hypothetical protein WA510_26710 [Acidobacteriaceae bacterium]